MTTTAIDTNAPTYWNDLREAHQLIERLRISIKDLKTAPMYVAGAWDDEIGGYEPIENIAPFENVQKLQAEVRANMLASRIAESHRMDLTQIPY